MRVPRRWSGGFPRNTPARRRRALKKRRPLEGSAREAPCVIFGRAATPIELSVYAPLGLGADRYGKCMGRDGNERRSNLLALASGPAGTSAEVGRQERHPAECSDPDAS